MTHPPKPVVLCILDGWGHAPASADNAIAQAATPHFDRLMRDFPHGLVNASELEVGLPEGQMGNSEVGHMNIGSGRVVMQELPKIDAAIASGALEQKPAFKEFIRAVKSSTGTVHLLGLLSPGGVHAHQHHMAVLANMLAKAGVSVEVHAFLDGRDTPPQSALEYLDTFEEAIAKAYSGSGERAVRIATVSGRYFAMDRDKRWERVEKAYRTIVHAEGPRLPSAKDAVEASYGEKVADEFVRPVVIDDYIGMRPGDGLMMCNFRADRARQLLTALLDPEFSGFARAERITFSASLGMVEYSTALAPFIPALFPPEALRDILGEIVANAGLKQLRIAETEKYAHVTFFFNGGREEPYPGEERILVPSPKVATYDLKPEMSAHEVTDHLVDAIRQDRFDLIVVNYANTDMVGHSGNVEAAKKAVEAVDTCLGRLMDTVLPKGGAMLVTADHGNAEQLHDDETGQAHTAHTLNLVPCIIASNAFEGKKITLPEGRLADIAPTVLALLGLPQPEAMTGRSLLLEKEF